MKKEMNKVDQKHHTVCIPFDSITVKSLLDNVNSYFEKYKDSNGMVDKSKFPHDEYLRIVDLVRHLEQCYMDEASKALNLCKKELKNRYQDNLKLKVKIKNNGRRK